MDDKCGTGNEPASGDKSAARKVVILFIDDDPTDRKLFDLSLRKVDSDLYDLTCVETLDEVRAVLSSRRVDYFVSDNRLHPTTTFRDTMIALEDLVIDGKIIVISSETDSVNFAEQSDLVHTPDMVRDKFSFFSDLRAVGLEALEESASQDDRSEMWRHGALLTRQSANPSGL